jgi:cell division transport system permease protein
MGWILLKRILKSGFVSFARNTVVSLSSVLVVTITLSVITSLIFVQAVLQSALTDIRDKVDVTIYFVPDASESKILALKESIEKIPEVASASYISSDEALAQFKERHKDDYLTLQALEELNENPLGATINVKARETSQYESIAEFLEGDGVLAKDSATIVDKVNYNQNKIIIERLNAIINGAEKLGFLVTLILIVISVIITLNTIRLTIYIAREEIGVMRLVGASNFYIRGPFIVEGIIYGVVSALITLIVFIPITIWLGNTMTDFLGINMAIYYKENFFQIALIVLASGAVLGSVSSFLAIRKYLNK